MELEIPKFIELRGCINCDVPKKCKEKTGHDYGFDHELVACCLIRGCFNQGHDLSNPFMDPEELMKKAKEIGNPRYIENAKKYLLEIEKKFGKFYEKMGIDLSSFLE